MSDEEPQEKDEKPRQRLSDTFPRGRPEPTPELLAAEEFARIWAHVDHKETDTWEPERGRAGRGGY